LNDMPGLRTEPAGTEIRREPREPRHTVHKTHSHLWNTLFPSRSALLIAIFTCIVAPVSLVALHIHENPTFSPTDEAEHWDYLKTLAEGKIPRLGQRLQPSTIRALECRLTGLHGFVLPPCGSLPSPKVYPGGGYEYEAQQPPGYYALTIPIRWIGIDVLGFDDLTASRIGGIVWLVAGLLLFWAAGRLLRLGPATVGLGALLIASAPAIVYQSSYVSNDASSVTAGAVALFLSALALRRPGRWMVPVMFVGGIFIVALKVSDALAIIVVSVLFGVLAYSMRSGLRASRQGGSQCLRWWWPRGGAILFGGAFGALTWTVIERRLALINARTLPSFSGLRKVPIGTTTILREALLMLQPLTGSYDPFRTTNSATPPMSSVSVDLQMIVATALQYLLLAGGLAGLFVIRRQWSHWVGLVTLPALYFGGVAVGIAIFITYDADPSISGRYALSLAPFLVLALIASIRGRWVERGLWIFALSSFGLGFFFLLSG